MRVPLNDLRRTALDERDALREALARVADSGWYVLGEEGRRFEAAFADYTGVPHALGVANGTDAIELALRALDVAPASEVITAANAGMYATTAIRRLGARPVYADVDEATMNLDVRALDAVATPATAAVARVPSAPSRASRSIRRRISARLATAAPSSPATTRSPSACARCASMAGARSTRWACRAASTAGSTRCRPRC